MTEDRVLKRSAAEWAAGRRGVALALLKDAVRVDPTRSDARLALAERYREMGNPDQAGRWGIVFEGWTTDRERDRLARLLASSWVRHQDVAEFLSLPPGELPAPVTDLLAGLVERYRERFDLEARERQGPGDEDPSRLHNLAFTLWALFLGGVLVSAFLVFGLAFFGVADTSSVRLLAFCLAAVGASAMLSTAVLYARSGEETVAAGWALAASVVLGFLLLPLVRG